MLIYSPVYDLFHCTFRMLQILIHVSDEISLEKLRILDFYLAFPAEILSIRLPREARSMRGYLKNIKNPYEIIIDSKKLFLKMEPFQHNAINFLASLGIVDSELIKEKIVKKKSELLPAEILEQIELRNKENSHIINILSQVLMKINLNGPDGLKARTNLMEHKYDVL